MIDPILIWFPTLIIYLFYYLFGSSFLSNFLIVIVIFCFLIYWFLRHHLSWPIKKEKWFTIFFIAFLVLAQITILYPFIHLPVVNNQQFIGFGGIGDYFKHSYVITTLVENGVHAKHPFFPLSDFKYYYGYYLIPALITSFFRQWQLVILSVYVLLANAFSYWLIKKVIDQNIKQIKLRWLVYFLAVIGYSFDALSMIMGKLYLTLPWYQAWKIDLQAGFRIMTTLQTAFWVPQHFLVGSLVVYLLSQLLSKKDTSLFQIFGVVFFSLLASAFVSIYLIFALGLIFLFIPKHRKNLICGGIFALIVLFPYIKTMLGNGTHLFSFYSISPYQYFHQNNFFYNSANWLITVFSQTGWLPLLTFITLLLLRKKIGFKKLLFWNVLLFGFMIITLFVRSSGYNDFGMRSMLPIQIGLPIVLGAAVERLKRSWQKYTIIGLMVLAAVVSSPGILSETISAWKARGLMSYDESRLILHIRSLPGNVRLAAVGRDEWIYKIPSMGFHSVLTNDLYDAAPYSDPSVNHTIVEVNLRELFIDPATDIRLKNPQELIRVLSPLPFDQLIIDENIYVKQGKNPWVIIFDQYQVPVEAKIGRFRLYKKSMLLSLLANHNIKLGDKQQTLVKDRSLPIKKGLWFVQVCSKTDEFVYFDLEDYYTLLSISLDKNQCAGNYFYHENDSPLRLSIQNTVKEVNVFPVLFN